MQVPFFKTFMDEREIAKVSETLRSGWTTSGPNVQLFEKRISEELLLGRKTCAVNSGTAALHLALKGIGIREDDEVIIPCNTFVATAEAVNYLRAKPVLCDVEEDTHNIDCSKIEELITPKTKAIIPVHFSGQPCDMEQIWNIAQNYGLKVVEDAAHALPSKYMGELIGLKSDAVCFSFYATKTLSTGEGGLIASSDDDVIQSVQTNRLHGIAKNAWERQNATNSWQYDILENGYKYNMTDIAASLGLVQLDKLFLMNEKRKNIVARYNEAFDQSGIHHLTIREGRESSNHLYVIKVNNRDNVIRHLKEIGVMCLVHFIPLQYFTYYQKSFGYKIEDFPVSSSVFEKSLSLPIYPGMTDDEVQYVIDAVKKVVA